jgi:hypothetical protein
MDTAPLGHPKQKLKEKEKIKKELRTQIGKHIV